MGGDPSDDERDDELFREIYGKEYTGPPKPAGDNSRNNSLKKRPTSENGSEEDNDMFDPNAVPTDFTSREAKVWGAKAKAIERNWKRKKEEELTCKICGEKGHFTQGCPSTLGGNRKISEIVEKLPIKDKRLKPKIVGSEGSNIERDTGCRLKVEEGSSGLSVRISGPDRAKVAMAMNALKRLANESEEDLRQQQNQSHSPASFGRGSNLNSLGSPERPHNNNNSMNNNNAGQSRIPKLHSYPPSSFDEERASIERNASLLEGGKREWEMGSKQDVVVGSVEPPYWKKGGWGAGSLYNKASLAETVSRSYGDSSCSNRTPHQMKGSPVDGKSQGQEQDQVVGLGGYERQQSIPESLEALEKRFMQETIEFTKEQNEAEDRENARHRECMRKIQEQYHQRMADLRAHQNKQREEFLQHELQTRQKQFQQQTEMNQYNYRMSGAVASFSGGVHDRAGYHAGGPVEDYHGYGSSLGSYRDDSKYYGSSYAYDAGAKINSGGMYSGNQGYDSRYYHR